MRGRRTWRRPTTSWTISGRTSTRPRTTARRGRRSSTAFRTTPSRAWFAKIRIARACWWRARRLGLFLSFDDGENWQSFQLNLPVTPITDLQFHKREKELVIGTEGRSFWVLDDVADALPVERLQRTEDAKLFQPKDTYRFGGGGRGGRVAAVARGRESSGRRGGAVLAEGAAAGRRHAGVPGCRRESGQQVLHARGAAPAGAVRRDEEENPFRGAPPARLTAQAGTESLRVEPALSGCHQRFPA